MTYPEVIDINMVRDGKRIHRDDIEKWFKEQGWSADDYTYYGTPRFMSNQMGWLFHDPSKAVMFKLVWG